MEIVESSPNRHIDLAVSFNGLDGTSYYEVVPSGSGSKVTWGFGYESGTSPLKRWKGLLLDRYIGAEYRDALAKLKDKIETERKPVAPMPPSATIVPEQPGAVAPGVAPEGAVPGTPAPAEAPVAEQPQAAPTATDPAATQAPPPPAAQPAPAASSTRTPTKRPRRP
jgi:hypothetical protein